jgi:cell division protein FtsQ
LKKIFTVAVLIVAAICLVALLSLFFSVRAFELEGDTLYDINEIIDASGVRSGDRLFWLNESKIEEKLISECPYIKSVKIKQKLPNKVCFVIEERVSGWYIQVGNDFYALDYDMKVIHETFNEEMLKERGLTKLILPELNSLVIGKVPEFASEDEHLRTETLKIINTVRNHPIKERLNYLDLSNRFQIKMVIDDTYDVDFGDMNDAETKLKTIEKMIEQTRKDGYAGGRITPISSTEYNFSPKFPDDAQESGEGEATE